MLDDLNYNAKVAVVPPREKGEQDIQITKNPDPRANENLSKTAGMDDSDTTGTGTEITDGEDG